MYRLPGAATGHLVRPLAHARSITLSLRKHVVAPGVVRVGDGFTECAASVPVKVQRRVSGQDGWKHHQYFHWAYKKRIRDRVGKYWAKVSEVTPSDVVPSADAPSHPFASEARLGQRLRQKNPASGKPIFS
jgi:hypothetical protein